MNKKKYYRNANGQGTVYKLSGHRRKPWVAATTLGWEINEKTGRKKQLQKPIGYYETRALALAALGNYNDDPYDLGGKRLTFSEVYEEWSKEYYATLANDSSARSYRAAYNHSLPLHEMPMINIKVKHLEECIREATVGDSTKARMKSLYNLMYKYSMKHEIVNKDYAALCMSVDVKVEKERIPFSSEEIQKLWDNLDIPWVDMILIGIYSGWRPKELMILKTEDIDIDDKTMFGGLKTDSGRNRCVPFNNKITDLIEKRYNEHNDQLFVDENGVNMTYDKLRSRWSKVMSRLGMEHTPHEMRHTFITLMKEANANDYILKLIVGHKIKDLTENVYTHRTIEDLRNEINKI